MRAIVFGADRDIKRIESSFEDTKIVAFLDNDKSKQGSRLEGISVVSPDRIIGYDYDIVIINSMSGRYDMIDQLLELGVPKEKINTSYCEYSIKAREEFIRYYSNIVYKMQIDGSVAEAGVYQGDFAKVINECFYDRKLYLFDTFEGFDSRDIAIERQNLFSDSIENHLDNTNMDMVLSKIPFSENVCIKKGYFPDTAKDIKDKFVFVNIDMDLYKPTIEGLNFFWPCMNNGGIILVHDYFSDDYKGVQQAVNEFIMEKGIIPFPISDKLSIAIQK